MAQVYGAGGKTVPKAGRLGTGSYYPQGTPLYNHKGNVFPGINVKRPEFTQLGFGDPSRAGIANVVGQNRAATQGVHPNESQYNNATLVKTPALTVASTNDNNNLTPVPPSQGPLVMPHERNTNSASGTKKKPVVFRTAFGASQTMPNDTAFERKPNANYKHTRRPHPAPAIEAVKKQAGTRTFARPANPPSASGGLKNSQQHRTPPASFVSRGNNWYDPHNSFIAGHTTTAGKGVGRWSIVKRGVV
jgi:hypothetical protein